jgi:O-antigen ligase
MKNKPLYAIVLLYTLCVYGPMAMMSIGAGVLFAGWLALRRKHLRDDLKLMRESPFFKPTLFFGLACLWSLVWAKWSGLTFMGMRPTVTWDDTRKAWHLIFPFILAACFARLTEAELRKTVKFWFFLGVASAVLGIIQYYVPIFEPSRLPHLDYQGYNPGTGILALLHGTYHATGFTGWHLSYASIIAFPAAVSLGLVAVLFRREHLSRRTRIAIAFSVAFFVATIFTYSKIAWASMPLTVVLIAIVGFKGWPRFALIGLVVAFCLAWATSSEFQMRFFRGTDTVKDRLEVWNANLEMIKEHPIFGVGWHRNSELSRAYYQSKGMRGFESHAHNNLLDQWATTGIVGLAGFIWWSVVAFALSWRIYKMNHDLLWRSLGLGLIGAWFCVHLNGMTQANWWDAKVLHQIGWVMAITTEVYRRSSRGCL